MNLQVVRTLVVKDITLFFRNRFFALVSGLGVVAYAAIFFLMPSTVDEELAIARELVASKYKSDLWNLVR